MKALTASKILIDGEWHTGKAVLVEDDKIQSVINAENLPDQIAIEDFPGCYLAPGYFDIQVNGGGGILLNDQPTVEGLKQVAAAHRQLGTTSFLPTLISDHWENMVCMADAIEEALDQNIPGIVGVHFEGPYLHLDRKGVHNENHIRPAEEKFLDLISNRNLGAVLVTLAPETVSAEYIQALINAGVKVSAGHTTASYEQTRQAMDAGLDGFTHLYNAMPPLLSRAPGVIGAALEGVPGYCGIIVDGYHVHPASLKAAIAAKSVDRMMLVSDAMPPVGTDMRSFKLGDQEITVSDGRCCTADGTLAGACISLEDAVKNTCKMLGLSLSDAVTMAATTPARYMGLDQRIGSIAQGKQADFVVLSEKGTVIQVI